MLRRFRRSASCTFEPKSDLSRLVSEAGSSDVCEETGTWNYLVVDFQGIRLRSSPSYSHQAKLTGETRIPEGTVVEVCRRRGQGLTRWLCLSSGQGWVFDVSPKESKVRMVEVEVLKGEWQYQAVHEKIPIVARPSPNSMLSTARNKTLGFEELVTITERVRLLNSKGSFLRLADGRGWVLDFRRGQQLIVQCAPVSVPSTTDTSRTQTPSSLPSSPNSNNSCDNGFSPADVFLDGILSSNCMVPTRTSSRWTAEPVTDYDINPPEHGEWSYIVLDPRGLTLRRAPRYDESAKIKGCKILEGQIVKAVERRTDAGTTFLRLEEPAGWAFDQQPDGMIGVAKQRRHRLVQVAPEFGSWFYRNCSGNGLHLRSRCTYAENAKVGEVLLYGAIFEVSERVKVGEAMFLKIKDSKTWTFDHREWKCMAEGPLNVEVPSQAVATVLMDCFVFAEPMDQEWVRRSKMLLEKARVQVNLIVDVKGIPWARICRPLGVSGWVQEAHLRFDVEPPCTSSRLSLANDPPQFPDRGEALTVDTFTSECSDIDKVKMSLTGAPSRRSLAWQCRLPVTEISITE